MNEIGGFFGLELVAGKSLHGSALALNNGRNALRLLLRASGVKRLHIPLFSCPAVVPAIRAEGVEVAYYRLTAELEPLDLPAPTANEAVLFINYFGLKEATVRRYAAEYDNAIVDQCQALFAAPLPGLGSIYSPRKFVGVADGGYLYSRVEVPATLDMDSSTDRYLPCLQRLDAGAPKAFAAYQKVEAALSQQQPALMSRLTRSILASIDYDAISRRRRENYALLHARLAGLNRFSEALAGEAVPMVYPFLTETQGLREYLIRHGIYVARYWPDPDGLLPPDPVSQTVSQQLLPLPIDQRYGASEMQRVAELVTAYLSQAGRARRTG